MSDSDEDLMPNSVLKYQHETAGFNRTNFNNTNITSYSFRNNMMTSTLNMPHMHQQGYKMRGFDQRSVYYRRETSPMSLRSFRDSGAQNFRDSIYNRGMSSQRSVFNGRSGSPMSMRSIDSNASVSAADIALAFKNVKFNKYDLRLIKEAYNKFMKNRIRKRIEKRRNLKLFSKGNRQRLGEDSGEQGSDSSISSDDCRSSRTILHKDNIPKSINRPLTTYDLTQFRTSMKENDMYKDCTENLKQNYLRNMFTVNSLKHTTNHTPQEKDENTSVVTLKERFAKGASFQWPSQRFNKSSYETSARNVITEIPRNKTNPHTQSENTKAIDTDSEKEEIFSQSIVKANSTHQSTMQQKRVLEDEESNSSNRKRSKTAISPIKENDSLSNNINIQNNEFNFKKPKMPVPKISNVKKGSVPEILIAKSRLPLTGDLDLDLPNNNNKSQHNNFYDEQNSVVQNKKLLQKTAEVIEPDCSNHTEVTQNTTDVSMRPSFLKRKLFTQKLDIAESKNISSDNLATNSPQTNIYNICREKNKVRKIVSSQSYCLSHDVLGDDNVLDLIHKIVPPDQMNMTNATNKKELSKNNIDNNDKWDVASVISMCNNDEGSDTYTDEEIFKVSQISNKTNTKQANKEVNKPTAVKNKMTEVQKPQPAVNNTIKLNTDCKVVVKKLETNACSWKNDAAKSQCQNKRTVISNCVKSFWDTDFESDMEERTVTPWTSKYQLKQDNAIHKDASKSSSDTNFNKKNFIKGTILTVRSFRSKGLNGSTRSDISRVSKQTDYDKTRQQKNNKTPNKNTKSSQNDEKKAQEQVVQSTKPQKNSRSKSNLSKVTIEKPKSKPVSTKETKSKKQKSKENNECNISRESLRLKQKKEQTEMNSSTQINKRGRPAKGSIEKKEDSIPKNSQTVNKKGVKSLKNPTIKLGNLNRTRQTPRKRNEKMQLSSSVDGSSLNISNILSTSLRVRRKNVK